MEMEYGVVFYIKEEKTTKTVFAIGAKNAIKKAALQLKKESHANEHPFSCDEINEAIEHAHAYLI